MLKSTDDLRIRELKELSPPLEVMGEFPPSEVATLMVASARHALHRILNGRDDRLAVVIGPCSVHDPAAALDYAGRLAAARRRFGRTLEIVMRVYFEKPRTTVGWKGLINDPDLDGSFAINKGLRLARSLLLDINTLGAPGGVRVPRRDDAAILRRSRRLGGDRGADHREPGASRTRLGPLLSGRLQERHRRQCADRGRRGAGGLAAAPFPGGDQERPRGDRLDDRERGLPRHPARRKDSQLRRGECRGGLVPNWREPGSGRS